MNRTSYIEDYMINNYYSFTEFYDTELYHYRQRLWVSNKYYNLATKEVTDNPPKLYPVITWGDYLDYVKHLIVGWGYDIPKDIIDDFNKSFALIWDIDDDIEGWSIELQELVYHILLQIDQLYNK